LNTARLQIIEDLRLMNGIESCASLQFNKDTLLDNQIRAILPDHCIFVLDLERNFMIAVKVHAPKFDRKSIGIHLLQKATTQRIMNRKGPSRIFRVKSCSG
jgi:hypothetical protein